ncbi:MAG: sulfatase-like hydrolase/transferase [Acidobacteria bacterium]|nr:sulfatase-like hydrolase/transferase [Acidobacteriota bacterium]
MLRCTVLERRVGTLGRRSCTKVLAFALLMLESALGSGAQQPGPPNLVVITIDTLRADRLGCYGYRNIKTPRIDALASDGVLVENAYTPVPLTLPAHASLFTGTYPVFHGVRDFTGDTLSEERATLATMLRSAGYSTGAVVASAVLEARWGINQGFDFYSDSFPSPTTQNWQPIAERRGDEVVRESLLWLERNSRAPFFLWVHLYDPHDPYTPPSPYDRQYATRPYDGEVAYSDENLGRIIDALKARGLYDNSLIILLSDHGESLGEHGEKTHGFFVYDSTLRIPMIFKLPGTAGPRARRIAGPVRIIDVIPTALSILGLSGKVRTPEVQGRNVHSALLGKASLSEVTSQAESMLPFYQFEWSPLLSIRKGRFKYIDAPVPELYDTAADPGEMRNLYADQKALALQFKAMLLGEVARFSSRKADVGPAQSMDPETFEKLLSLGYIAHGRRSAAQVRGRNLPDPKERIQVYNLIFDGTLAARNADYGRAAKLLSEAVRREPVSLVAHFQLGVVYRVTNAFDRAEQEFRKVLELRPGYDLALRRLAEVHMAGGRYQEAERAYKEVLAQSPDDAAVHFSLGGLYVTVDRWDEALAAFRKAQALNPKDVLIPMIISRILIKKGDLAGALAAVQQALNLKPDLIAGYETALEIYQKQGRAAEAEKTARILERLRTKP